MKCCYLFVLLGLLAGCGGSSSESSTPPPTSNSLSPATPLKQTASYAVYGQTNLNVSQSAGLVVTNLAQQPLDRVTWTQLAGPQVAILSPNSQAIGFDISQAGSYLFELRLNYSSGQQLTDTIELNVSDQAVDGVKARLDHMVSEGGKVSLIMQAESAQEVTAWQWQQRFGSQSVSLDENDNQVFFTAPRVDQDTVLVFQGNATLDDGSVVSDQVMVLVKDTAINERGFFPSSSNKIVSSLVAPYRQNSPYATALNECIYNNQVERSCSFLTLPLIGTVNSSPSKDDILNRLLVSHPWMGQRFEQFLDQSITSPDMLALLGATTAIVISYDIRPSFYWSATGAIYLDAANFWVTPQERDTLNTQPDYRSDFGNELSFIIPWRYVKDGEYYTSANRYPRELRKTKSFVDMEADISWLMYHELAHANDFFPPSAWPGISTSTSPLDYSRNNEPDSTLFRLRYPLNSQEMIGLAQVSFAGATATNQQKAYLPDDVASFFKQDTAPAYYSYSTIREDYATLFERTMMAYRLNASADVAIVEASGDEYLVTWGQRDRINQPEIQDRAAYVLSQILPGRDIQHIQASLPEPQMLRPGISYFDQLRLPSSGMDRVEQDQFKQGERYDIRQDLVVPHLFLQD